MDDNSVAGAGVIAKRLASCNNAARDRAVRSLLSFLPSPAAGDVSDAELLKIWKGLFYCYWHADKPPNQLRLAENLASLVVDIPPALAGRYLAAFFITMRREWAGIDFLRLDKFYLLIRRFVRNSFRLIKKHSWGLSVTSKVVDVFSENSMFADDRFMAGGVNYQLADVFLDELREFVPVPVESFEVLIRPFVSVLERSLDRVLVNKVKMNVFEKLIGYGGRLLSLEKDGKRDEAEVDVENYGSVALGVKLSKKLFEAASGEGTLQANRKVLFGLHESFLKLEGEMEKSGICISIVHLENGCLEMVGGADVSDGVVEQVANGVELGDSGLEEKLVKKKRKKSKKDLENKAKTGKLEKKNKKVKNADTAIEAEADEIVGDSADGDMIETNEAIDFDENVISNLQKQFEKAAAEAGINGIGERLSALRTITVDGASRRKRKRAKSKAEKVIDSSKTDNGDSIVVKSGEKSVKKVRFSMKNNVVWKPHNPLPPQSVRLPPSATPRGSALKKGVPPGPIRESPPTAKKIKVKTNSLKKSKKSLKGPSIVVKRIRKLQSFSV